MAEQLQQRSYYIIALMAAIVLLFIGKLFHIQVADETFTTAAKNNAVQKIIDYPYRGEIYDRNGQLLVKNQAVFDVMVVPREIKGLDTTRFCRLFNIPKEEFLERMAEAKNYSRIKPSPFIRQISLEDWQRIQDQFIDFPGFYTTTRTVRSYPHGVMGVGLGYLAEVSKPFLEKQGKDGYYRMGDYIGISGLESQYELQMRGRRGVKYQLVNVHGEVKGRFMGGDFDTLSQKGADLYTHVDLDLQLLAESLMVGKAGSIVAIDPKTGGILSFVNAPTYDPNQLRGRDFSKNYRVLQQDKYLPLFNRPLMSMYPPGSIFKLIQGLIGQQLGVITENTGFPCNTSIVKCHNHPPARSLIMATQYSCNPYFLAAYRRIINQDKSPNTFVDSRLGYQQWRDYISAFGVGQKLGVDLPNEKKGILPSTNYFDKVYGANQWKYSNIRSISIGQGEVGMVPLQMANVAAAIANRGHYFTPHFIKSINDTTPTRFTERHETGIDPRYFDPIIEGMQRAVDAGTVSSKARLKGVAICGKTGTAQNPQGDDHSVFIAFAPRDNPTIAIAVFVENAGFGGLVAAPIATLMIEKYLTDTITRVPLKEKLLKADYLYNKPNAYNKKQL